jgi:hypothetical protein
MRKKLPFNLVMIFISCLVFCCNANHDSKTVSQTSVADDVASTNTVGFDKVPEPDDFYHSPMGLQIIDTLESRFTKDFISFNKEVKAGHAKLYVCYITSELGNSLTKCERKEKPFIKDLCEKQDVSFIDFTDDLKNQPGITFMPIDGHFNKKGAILVANKMSGIIESNHGYRSDIDYPASSRPALLGDDEPGIDKLVEDKKGLPYKFVTNAQGLRMDGPVEFPKKKQHVLLMGDSQIYLAGVDNPETITGLLQKKYPDKTIINSSKWAYTIDDELSQWQQRTKYTEPDIVLLEVNGRNITNLYFSQKLKFHRIGGNENFAPTVLEGKFYDTNFK